MKTYRFDKLIKEAIDGLDSFGSKFDKLIKEAIDGLDLPSNFECSFGSCMLAAKILVRKLLRLGRNDFKVIEGYITFPNVEWNEQHTWIEMDDGEIIDPTKMQWGIKKEIVYLSLRRKEYTPYEYLELAAKYPDEDNPKKYLGNYQYIGKCGSTVDDSCIWDATEMAQLIDDSSPLDIEGIYPFISNKLKQKVDDNYFNFKCRINGNIAFVYDINNNIYYFYKKS
jgi:hypothetical protein